MEESIEMFVKNLLRAGDYVSVVPIGLRTTIQYDENGVIEKIFRGHHDAKEDITDIVLPKILMKNGLDVPTQINVKKGTTFVTGVLYTRHKFAIGGKLPECIEKRILSDLKSDDNKYTFYAGDATSYACVFQGSTAINRWLTMNGFRQLPGFLVPVGITEAMFENIVNKESFPFEYPLISQYLIFHNGIGSYSSTNISQGVIKEISDIVEDDGSIVSLVKFDYPESSMRIPYSEVVRLQLQIGSIVTFDAMFNIINSIRPKMSVEVPRRYTCKYCGNVFDVPFSGITKCTNLNCTSRMYASVKKFVSSLDLPDISMEEYKTCTEYIGDTFILTDIFDFPKFENCKVETSITKLMSASIPDNVFRSEDDISIFVNRCNNSINSVKYYIRHPEQILSSLCQDISHRYVAFVAWVSIGINATSLIAMIDDDHIIITKTNRKFDGIPMLRNKTIAITGIFNHGSLQEVASILNSYSANVVFGNCHEKIDCVIVGNINENVDGSLINRARDENIAVFTESEFFARYDIDSDLRENLS